MKTFKFIALALILMLSNACAQKETTNNYTQWAKTIADSEIQHNPELWQADFLKKPKWDYTQGLVAKSMLQLFEETKDSSYYNYVKTFADFFIDNDGNILTYKLESYNIDRINGGKFLFDMYNYTKDEKYIKAIKLLRSQLDTHPRVAAGGFWHKKIYPHQMWLDGLYMGAPFYAQCIVEFDEPSNLFDDVANQFVLVDSVTLDKETGLNYHGWDESREQQWANKETGQSPNFWSRSIGWYMMAMVDVLDFLPQEHPQRPTIINNLNRLSEALLQFRDKETGMWYQVTNLPQAEGNYLESSGSTMFVYAMAKGARMGYLPEKFRQIAKESFDGLTKFSTQENEDGTTSITRACSVAGLGGNPYRDGTYEYYVNEPIRNDDPKVIGPFIMAGIELSK